VYYSVLYSNVVQYSRLYSSVLYCVGL